MGALAALIVKEVQRRLARRAHVDKYLWLIPLVPALAIGAVVLVVALFVAMEAGAMNSGNCGASAVSVTAPGINVQTAGQIVRYFESQGIAANAAAGIVGNLQQENGFSPVTNGGGVGIAQWDPVTRGPAMQDWVRKNVPAQNGVEPAATLAGQLAYIVYDLKTNYAKLLAEMNVAPDPGTAAVLFQNNYEHCGNCVQGQRVLYAQAALQAAGGSTSSTVLVAFSPGGSCLAGGNAGYVNPTSQLSPPGGSPSRVDMGVDYTGSGPILAIGDGVILSTNGHGWPGLSYILEQLTGGAYAGKCWYYAENIQPTVQPGATVTAGQQVGILLSGYPWSELGWADCASPGTTLAAQLNEQAPGKDPGNWTSAVGASANRLLVSLGAQSGQMQAGGPHGPLPAGYP